MGPRAAAAVCLLVSIGVAGCGGYSTRSESGRPSASATPVTSTETSVRRVVTSAPVTATAVSAPATRTTASGVGSPRHGTQPPLLPPPPIAMTLIPFPQSRKDEMRAYSLRHYGIDSYRLSRPHLIIWHYTDSTTYASAYNTFADDVPDVQFHELPQVCTHFVITTHGTIHQLVPLDLMCRQVVGLNYTAIGIENVGVSDQQVLADRGQYRAALRLTQWLRCRFHIPVRNVIGHNESLQSPYFRELVPAFRGQTHSDFDRHDMNIVRAAVARLACRA